MHGSRLARAVLRWMGWQVLCNGLPARQGVMVVYPHTSNWDFVFGILTKWTLGMEAHFWGKESLFRVPLLGRWMRWLGGVPVVRDAPGGIVGQYTQALLDAREKDQFLWLVLAPEGTRQRTEGWRSGFYRAALGAKVPLGLARMDYGRRCIDLTHFLQLSGDAQVDMQQIAEVMQGTQGRHGALASPVQWLEKSQ